MCNDDSKASVLPIVYSFHRDAPAACAASGQQPATPGRFTRTVRSGGRGEGGQLLRPAGEQCPACWPPAISSSLFLFFHSPCIMYEYFYLSTNKDVYTYKYVHLHQLQSKVGGRQIRLEILNP